MKKKVFKKLICTVLTAVCIVTSVVPTFAEDTVTTTEAATVKNITSVYKYHLDGYDKKGKLNLSRKELLPKIEKKEEKKKEDKPKE